jgi:hypothetical protein
MRKIDFNSLDPMAFSFMKIALFAVVLLIVMFIVLVVLKKSGKLAGLSAAQQEQRDYKKDLQEIVNKYPVQMRGLDWIFADYYEPIYNRFKRETIFSRYHSYIVGFGENRMVIIPVNVRGREITNSEPILVAPENVAQFSSSRGNNVVSLTGLELIHIRKFSMTGRKHITGRTVLYIEGVSAPIIFYQKNKTKKIVTILDLAVYHNTEPPDTEKLDMLDNRTNYSSKAAIEQEEENSKYGIFIQEFKKEIKMRYPKKVIRIQPLNMIIYLFFVLTISGIVIFILSIVVMVIVAKLKGK